MPICSVSGSNKGVHLFRSTGHAHYEPSPHESLHMRDVHQVMSPYFSCPGFQLCSLVAASHDAAYQDPICKVHPFSPPNILFESEKNVVLLGFETLILPLRAASRWRVQRLSRRRGLNTQRGRGLVGDRNVKTSCKRGARKRGYNIETATKGSSETS